MSGVNGKTELPPLLLSRPEFRFPLASVSEHTWIETSPWANIGSISRMAQCNRVQRPPPPPHYIAQSRKNMPNVNMDTSGLGLQMDPVQRVKQLEKSLVFVRDSHAVILQSLHKEVDDLKKKNRELQFQLVVGASSPGEDSEHLNGDISPEAQKKIEKLDKEVRKLRNVLRDTLKANANLSLQLEAAKREHFFKRNPQIEYPATDTATSVDVKSEGNLRIPTPGGPSPKIEEYSDTLRQIQQASARTRSCKNETSRQEFKSNYHWGSGQMEHGHRYSDFQGHLPQLPLRNQQNHHSQQQVEMHSLRRPDMLPTIKKPMFPVLDRNDKSHKPRGNQRPRFNGNLHQH